MGQGGSGQKKALLTHKSTGIENKVVCLVDNPGRIQECYDVDRTRIGEGSFATIFKCANKSTGFQRAIKVLSKAKSKNIPKWYHEIAMLKSVDHPNIIKYYESFQDRRFIYVIMELCQGAELFDLLNEVDHLGEMETAALMQQVFRAMTYMHAVHIVHRDLKTENFMLYKKDTEVIENTIKIIDFGLAIELVVDKERSTEEQEVFIPLTEKCGAPFYVAPQVLAGSYDHMADVWSLGVLMYTLLAGYPPFYGGSDSDVLGKVRLGNYQFNAADFKVISSEAKQLIRDLLKISPIERIDAAGALQSPWIQLKAPPNSEMPLRTSLISALKSFGAANLLKRSGLYVIAGLLTDEELAPAVDSFNFLDVEGDGNLGVEEIFNGLVRAQVKEVPSVEDLTEILAKMDSDGSGKIEFTEFLSATIDRKYITETNVWSAFRVFDINGDGKISQTEMHRVLNGRAAEGEEDVSPQEVIALMNELSPDGDKYVDFQEFFAMMRGGSPGDGRKSRKTTKKSTYGKRETEF